MTLASYRVEDMVQLDVVREDSHHENDTS